MNPPPELKTDVSLFAKLLPDVVAWDGDCNLLFKVKTRTHGRGPVYHEPVLETEYLHLCHLAENTLDEGWDIMNSNAPRYKYSRILYRVVDGDKQPFRATWQQRLTALVEVRGLKRLHLMIILFAARYTNHFACKVFRPCLYRRVREVFVLAKLLMEKLFAKTSQDAANGQ